MNSIAQALKKAQDEVLHINPISQSVPDFDLVAAYRLAADIQTRRVAAGARFLGRKIGFTNPQLWTQFGVDAPIWGAMYDHSVIQMKEGQVACDLASFSEPKIEPEIVLHFHKTPVGASTPEDLLSCIDWVAPGFEIVQSHFPGWRFTAADAVADGSLHGALLLGPPHPLQALGDDAAACLEMLTVSLSCSGQLRETGSGANVLGNPLNAVLHLIHELARDGMAPIEAGELITTGSMTSAFSVSPGEQWNAAFMHVPFDEICVSFE
ncbi:2-keto-4-pentenoate hydratase [Pusillimonas sp. ANT_WB101]|uniref:2-keto-4-pentenoate hydratase n=1 Tax=Pusillimonas sp. ANT_WB101 TaxID=2597356 RepID=UPI0011EEE23A|nr:fumarylacetoacetate hydrolase family protein [Pusillimonas sp. ANT_WB101]KAA0910790.1 decarboxylase [Pusillimonas sp. ANT_WB101]